MKTDKIIAADTKDYLAKVKAELKRMKCAFMLRPVIIKDIRKRISDYIDDFSPSTIDFVEAFGTPENIVTDYYAIDVIENLKKRAKRYFILKIIFAVVMVVVAIAFYFFIRAIISNSEAIDIEDPEESTVSIVCKNSFVN